MLLQVVYINDACTAVFFQEKWHSVKWHLRIRNYLKVQTYLKHCKNTQTLSGYMWM